MGQLAALLAQAKRILLPAGIALRSIWSHCQTGRGFAIMVWATCVLAAFHSAGQASVPTGSPVTQGFFTPPVFDGTAGAPPLPAGQVGSPVSPGTSHDTLAVCDADREIVRGCWGASLMQVTEAWHVTHSPDTVLVAVLDTGIDTDGTGLAARIEDSVSLVHASGIGDVLGHGTHVAGTIAAIAPNSRLLNVKVADDHGFCESRCVAEGILLAANRGAVVINLSLEVDPSPELEAAVAYAWERGAVVVAAAGMPRSTGSAVRHAGETSPVPDSPCRPALSPPVYPAFYESVIAVTGVSESGDLAPVSNRAPWVDVAAPGVCTFSATPGGGHGYLTGTSTAAAHVSGLAALLCGLAEDRNGNGMVNDEVRFAMESTAIPMDLEGTGSGIVNVLAAVTSLSRQVDPLSLPPPGE
ncbi:MAG: S8 family serine peptidase [Dehalococcoidia bacterium]|jgi:subtilisin family serine protease|nr:S8 family serine peptidase [Dehalococcoidia bacterium]